MGILVPKNFVNPDVNKMLKRVSSQMSFYVFKQRLQYKCVLYGIKYAEIDEYCTSKCCSNCGYYKKDLGKAKIYKCNKCKLIFYRDVNAAKNIYMISIK